MAQSPNAVHRDDVSPARTRIAQSVENGDACTHERSGFFRRQIAGNRRQCSRGRNHVFLITAVKVDAGNFAFETHGKVAFSTLLAHEAVPTMPTDTNPLTSCPGRHVIAQRIDAPANFMTWNTRILKPRPETVFDEHVAVTDAAGLNFNANLPCAWFRDISLNQFPISAGFTDLRCLHFVAHDCCYSVKKRKPT